VPAGGLSRCRSQSSARSSRRDADLHLGRHTEVIAELRDLVGAHPLREHLHALLMLALYRDGRQGEALAAYQQARRVLVEELGAEPGTELSELHQRVLTADPGLARPKPAPASEAATWDSLGFAHLHLGHYAEAVDCYARAWRSTS